MSVDKKLMAGSTDLLILKLVEQEDMYGYQMIDELKKRSNDVFDMKAGTLYPLLHTLVQKGYLTAYDQAAGEARVRKYYHLTDKGRKQLVQRERDWKVFSEAVGGVLGGASVVLG